MARYDPYDLLMHALDTLMDEQTTDDVETLVAADRVMSAALAVRDHHLVDLIGHGHTQDEVAGALGITQQAVSKQLTGARKRERARRQTARKANGGGS